MATTGTPTVAQRTFQQSASFKALAKRIASKLRCGLPGIITAFDPIKQYASVQLAITENLIKTTGGVEIKRIPIIDDVLVLFPGDANWCLTFPSIVGCECYVCFADMCINAWATHGFGGALPKPIPRNQEVQRRHDLSDGFAILAPRSQPKVIPSFSTTEVELRSMDGTVKIALGPFSISITAPDIFLNGNVWCSADVVGQPGSISLVTHEHLGAAVGKPGGPPIPLVAVSKPGPDEPLPEPKAPDYEL